MADKTFGFESWLKELLPKGTAVEVTAGPYRDYDVEVNLSGPVPKVDFYSLCRVYSDRAGNAVRYAAACIIEKRILSPSEFAARSQNIRRN